MESYWIYSIPGFTDPVSSLSHLLGAFVFLLLSFFLIRKSWGDVGRVVSIAVFAFSAIFLLSMSGTYHLLSHDTTGRMVLQRLDHAGIFLLIVGTMTPIHTILFEGILRWGWIVMIWAIAVTAITLKTIYFTDLSEWLGLSLYLGLGWMGAFTFILVWKKLGFQLAAPILYGSLFYTLGAIFEFTREPILISGVLQSHEIFHVTVLMGISFHWYFVNRIARLHPNSPNFAFQRLKFTRRIKSQA